MDLNFWLITKYIVKQLETFSPLPHPPPPPPPPAATKIISGNFKTRLNKKWDFKVSWVSWVLIIQQFIISIVYWNIPVTDHEGLVREERHGFSPLFNIGIQLRLQDMLRGQFYVYLFNVWNISLCSYSTPSGVCLTGIS